MRYFRPLLIATALAVALAAGSPRVATGQEVVDRTVAVISDSTRRPQIITYSELVWQLALQPGAPIDPPRPQDLSAALQTLIDQRIFALEAERQPRPALTPKEIEDQIADIVARFPTPGAFQTRLRQVGFSSVKDEAFERLIAQRLAIEKFVDFRFASFVVVTADEETRYYRDVFTPEFRRSSPGLLLPPFEEVRGRIYDEVRLQKVAAAIEKFLEETKRRVQVEIVYKI